MGMAFATHLRQTTTKQRRGVMQSSTGELQDMNGGRDEEGGDEHIGRTEPELALCVTQA